MRFISWLPRRFQDRYIAHRLGVAEIDHVEFYSRRSLCRLLQRFFAISAVEVRRNSNRPDKAHYLRAVVHVNGPEDIVAG